MNNQAEIRRNIVAYILPEDPSGPQEAVFSRLFDKEFFLSLFMGRWPIILIESKTLLQGEAVEYICKAPIRPLDDKRTKEQHKFLIVTQQYLKTDQSLSVLLESDIQTSIIILRTPGVTLRSTRDRLRKHGVACAKYSLPIRSMENWSDSYDTGFTQLMTTDDIKSKIRNFTAPITTEDLINMAKCILSEFIPNSICGIYQKIATGALDIIAKKLIQ